MAVLFSRSALGAATAIVHFVHACSTLQEHFLGDEKIGQHSGLQVAPQVDKTDGGAQGRLAILLSAFLESWERTEFS